MFYTNAYNGLKKIYSAQILMLVTGLLSSVASVFAQRATEESAAGGVTAGSAFGVMIPILGAALLSIIASLIEYFGLKEAAQDDDSFRKAYIYAIAGIAVSAVMAVLSLLNIKSEIISDVGHVIESFIDTVVALYVISGIRNIANKIGQTDMDTRGKKVFAVYAASIILASIVELAAAFMQGGPRIAVVAVLGAIFIVLTIAGYFMYLSYLSKAKKMLA